MTGLVEGKAALVTGGSSGIGRASARLLALEGARVLVCDIDESGGQATVESIKSEGGQAKFQRTDVREPSEVKAMVERCVVDYGTLDCAVNNAGVAGPRGSVESISPEDWNTTLAINLGGIFLCMREEIPIMRSQGGGAIVNLSSGAGMIATPFMSAYCASKHAVLGLTRSAAVENARARIRINAVCPGSTDTPMLRTAMESNAEVKQMILASTATGRLGTPEEVAQAVVWLCSDRATLMSGDSMLVDGGSVAR